MPAALDWFKNFKILNFFFQELFSKGKAANLMPLRYGHSRMQLYIQ